MCPSCRAMISGATLLPFGLMTDVSAGALAAGTGALPGLGKPVGGPVGTSDFETELTAFSDVTTNGAPGMPDGTEFAGGEFPLAFAALFNLVEPGLDPEAGGEAPEAAGPAGPAPLPVPDADGEGVAPVPAGAAAPLPGSSLPPAGGAARAPETGPPDVPELPGQPSAQTAQSQPIPAGPPEGFADEQQARPANTPIQPLPPVQPVQFGAAAQTGGLQNGPAAPAQAAVKVPGSQPDADPVPVSQAARVVVPEAAVPDKNAPANTPRPAEPAPPPEQDAGAAAAQRPAQVAVPSATAQPAAQLLANGRRWQSELPSELRAPVPAFPRSAEVVLPPQAAAASALADGTTSPPAASSAPAGGSAQAQTVPVQTPVPASTLPETGTRVAQPASDAPVAGSDPLPAAGSERQGNRPEAAPLIQVARQGPQNTGPGPLTPQVASDPSADAAPEGVEPVSLKTETGVTDNKAPQQATGPDNQSPGRVPHGDTNSAPQAGANVADARPAAGPLAAAALAPQAPVDDPDLLTKPVEFTTTGDFAATVRGGETHGAVRTESLQTPSQAQSGQVATQVAAEIARHLKNGQTRFQMRFDPPELGRVDVNMRVGADGGVQAHLIVERPETLDMFLRDQRSLERALEAAGLSTNSENLQFSLKQDGGRGFASGDGQGDQGGHVAEGAGGPEGDDLDPETEEIIRLTLAESRGGLDVKI